MVSKTYVPIPVTQRQRKRYNYNYNNYSNNEIPTLISSTETESVSTLGMHDIATTTTTTTAPSYNNVDFAAIAEHRLSKITLPNPVATLTSLSSSTPRTAIAAALTTPQTNNTASLYQQRQQHGARNVATSLSLSPEEGRDERIIRNVSRFDNNNNNNGSSQRETSLRYHHYRHGQQHVRPAPVAFQNQSHQRQPQPSSGSRVVVEQLVQQRLEQERERQRQRRHQRRPESTKITKNKQPRTATSRKKQFTRNPQLQDALNRNRQRRQEEEEEDTGYDGYHHRETVTSHPAAAAIVPVYPRGLSMPPLVLNDDGEVYTEEDGGRTQRRQPSPPQSRRQQQQHRPPQSNIVGKEPRRGQVHEFRDVVDIFSEYETILDRLVYKHAKLQSYMGKVDHLPLGFAATSDAVRERMEKLRRDKEQNTEWNERSKSLPRTRNGSYNDDESQNASYYSDESHVPSRVHRRNATMNVHGPTIANDDSQETRQSIQRSKSANPALRRQRESHISKPVVPSNPPKSPERPRYGRNEGFIHGRDLKQAASEPILCSGHPKNSHLLYRRDGKKEDSVPIVDTNTLAPSKSKENGLSLVKSKRIEELRKELAHLRQKRHNSPSPAKKAQYLEDHLRAKKNHSTRPKETLDKAALEPAPAIPTGIFCAPMSPSSVDPAGEHYNPLTTASKIQPVDRRDQQRLDAPGSTIQHVKERVESLRFKKLSGSDSLQPPTPDFESTIIRHDEPSALLHQSSNPVQRDEAEEDSIVKEIHQTLSRDRQRIEEIEKRVNNQLDDELEREILKMSPRPHSVKFSFPDERSLSSSDDDGDSSGSDYDTETSGEMNKHAPSRVHIRSSIRAGPQKKLHPELLPGSTRRIQEQKRREEFLQGLAEKRNSRSPQRPAKLSELMPEGSREKYRRSRPTLRRVPSLSSTDDDSDKEPQNYFLPVSPPNRGQWQPYITVQPENQIEAILSSFSDTATHFFANAFSQDPDDEQFLGCKNSGLVHDSRRVSFDTLNLQAKHRQHSDSGGYSDNESTEQDDQSLNIEVVESADGMISGSGGYSDNESVEQDDQSLNIEVVESADGMIHVDYENYTAAELEKAWKDESEYEYDFVVPKQPIDTSGTNASVATGEHLRQHPKHFLEPAPSYKDPREHVYPDDARKDPIGSGFDESVTEDVNKNDNCAVLRPPASSYKDPWEQVNPGNARADPTGSSLDKSVTKDMNKDDISAVLQPKASGYNVPDENASTDEEGRMETRHGVLNDEAGAEKEPEPTATAAEDVHAAILARSTLRQMSSNLLSSDSSSISTTNESNTNTKESHSTANADTVCEIPKARSDRYSPIPVFMATNSKTAPVPIGTLEPTSVARPPQFKKQRDPPSKDPLQIGVLHHDHPQEERAAVVVSPRGSAIESTKNQSSWKNPFNFW